MFNKLLLNKTQSNKLLMTVLQKLWKKQRTVNNQQNYEYRTVGSASNDSDSSLQEIK
jgi:hypothetical protein